MTNKKSAAKQRAAAARARLEAEKRRQRLIRVGSAVGGVLAVIATLVVVGIATDAGSNESGQQATAATDGVINEVTAVPAGVLDQVGVGSVEGTPKRIDAPLLQSDGKPRVLYVGAEYCPFCAAERWPVIVALSRFGTFTNLSQTASSPSDVHPNTATLTFHGSSYTSDYVALTAKELQSNQVQNGRYAPLDTLSAEDEAVFAKYNTKEYLGDYAGGIPFMDIGGRYLSAGASYQPELLKGKTHEQIAAALSDPNSEIARAVDGSANLITAALCELTGGKPGAVCSSSGVKAAAARLNSAG